jgi:hypothetical protein
MTRRTGFRRLWTEHAGVEAVMLVVGAPLRTTQAATTPTGYPAAWRLRKAMSTWASTGSASKPAVGRSDAYVGDRVDTSSTRLPTPASGSRPTRRTAARAA